jgi:hypothetical protein
VTPVKWRLWRLHTVSPKLVSCVFQRGYFLRGSVPGKTLPPTLVRGTGVREACLPAPSYSWQHHTSPTNRSKKAKAPGQNNPTHNYPWPRKKRHHSWNKIASCTGAQFDYSNHFTCQKCRALPLEHTSRINQDNTPKPAQQSQGFLPLLDTSNFRDEYSWGSSHDFTNLEGQPPPLYLSLKPTSFLDRTH